MESSEKIIPMYDFFTAICFGAKTNSPLWQKKNRLREFGLYFYEQGNQVLEQFYSNISGTYHFLPEDDAVALKYYIFDKGLTNRFARKKEGEPDGGK